MSDCLRAGPLARPKLLAWVFLLCALPTGLGCAFFAPVRMFPDAAAHIVRADGLRYGYVFGQPPPPGFPPMAPGAGVPLNQGLFSILSNPDFIQLFPRTARQHAALRRAAAARWGRASYWPTQMVEYFPIFYVPAAVGLAAGQALGLSPLATLFAARVLMLLAYIGLGMAALLLARRGGGLLFAVLTLPTAINLAGSFNQDGLMFAACVLAAALLTRGGAAWFVGLGLLSAVVSAKPPYAPLLLLALLPLCAAGFWRRAGFLLLAAIPPALWLLHIAQGGFLPVPTAPYHPGPLWPGPHDIFLHDTAPRNNIQTLLARPWEIIRLPVISLTFWWGITWKLVLGMVGRDHGLIAPWEYPCLVASLGLAALGAARRGPLADAGLAGLAIFAAFIGMELSLYLTFTQAGCLVVMGVQSRYFLPFLPFFIFLLPALGWLPGVGRLPPGWCTLPAMVLAAVNAVALPVFIFHLYRLAGP